MKITVNDIEFTITPYEQKLPPELKAQWVTALRSGTYKQGKDILFHDGCYCCLGVLSHIQGRLTPNGGDGENGNTILLDFFNPFRWLCDANIAKSAEPRVSLGVSSLNDRGLTFSQIADIIDYAL